MEAQKLKKRKNTISKGKIKKTIKNVICRPDPIFWPVVNEAEEIILKTTLENHRVYIPEYKKPHWNDIKSIPKNKRSHPPRTQKVEGLLFGISSCCGALQIQNCSAVLIEANVNPQLIVQPIIEACISSKIPILCLKKLRRLSLTYFGIQTSCLGVKKEYLQALSDKIQEIFKNYKLEEQSTPVPIKCSEDDILVDKVKKEDPQMDTAVYCPYVYRSDRKSRAFVPDTSEYIKNDSKFTGQQFIKLPQEAKPETDRKTYMKMILKKVMNNPNRVKMKRKI